MRKKVTNTKREPLHKVNSDIRALEVRLIGDNIPKTGEVVDTNDAQKLANIMELDLVEINAKSEPPICQIVDYKKFLYEEKKKQKELIKNQKDKTKGLKEIQMKPNIDSNDLSVKKKKILEFFEKGHKVKITMKFSGREKFMESTLNKGEYILLKLSEEFSEISKTDNLPKLSGSSMIMSLTPKK
jgi:translation initiation factor IF-3